MNIFSHFSSRSDGGWELRDRHERKTLHFILTFPYAHLRAGYASKKTKLEHPWEENTKAM